MAVKKVVGSPGIDGVINAIEKLFGKSDLITLGPNRSKIGAVSTGSLKLDLGIGIGGLPRGRIIEIYGPESSGKTSLALATAAQYEANKHTWGHQDRWVLIVDAEHSITIEQIEGFGLDPDRIVFARPDTGSEALQIMMDLVKTGEIGFAIFDSIDAVQTEAQLKKKMNEQEMGGASKVLNRFFREFVKTCLKTETTAVFMNQLKYNPGVMFGSQLNKSYAIVL